MTSEISGKQRRYLRGLAHPLEPTVIVGQRGVTASVVRQVHQALDDHELIKVKLAAACPVDREEAAALIALQTECEVAGIVGHVLILYRRNRVEPRIELPWGGGEGARDAATGDSEEP